MAIQNPYNRQKAAKDEYDKMQAIQRRYQQNMSGGNREGVEDIKGELGLERGMAVQETRDGRYGQGSRNNAKEAYEKTKRTDEQARDFIQRRLDELQRNQRSAFVDDTRDMVNSFSPERLQMEQFTNPGQLQEFEAQRNRFVNQQRASAMSNQNAMTRRFAAMGNLNSGAALKQEQIAKDRELRAQNEGVENINAAEAGAIRQMNEASKQRNAAREQFNSDQDFRSQMFKFDANSKLGQMEMALDSTDWQRRMDEYNQGINAQMIEMSKPSKFQQVLGDIKGVVDIGQGIANTVGAFIPGAKK